jgi:hypothetical protein
VNTRLIAAFFVPPPAVAPLEECPAASDRQTRKNIERTEPEAGKANAAIGSEASVAEALQESIRVVNRPVARRLIFRMPYRQNDESAAHLRSIGAFDAFIALVVPKSDRIACVQEDFDVGRPLPHDVGETSLKVRAEQGPW